MNIDDKPPTRQETKIMRTAVLKVSHFPWCGYGKTRSHIPIEECGCECYELTYLRYGQLMERYKYIGFK